MQNSNFKHKKIDSITLKENTYQIIVPIKKSMLEKSDDYYFILKDRDHENTIIKLDYEIRENVEELTIFNVIISVDINDQYKELILNNTILDLYFVTLGDEIEKITRIKSNTDNHRFLALVFSEQTKMFYPFTTKKGNISFRSNEYTLFAKVDEVNISKNGKLNIAGFFNYPPLFNEKDYEVNKLNLVITNNLDDNEIILPMKCIDRKDISETIGNDKLEPCGFQIEFDPRLYLLKSDKTQFFKFYLELEYTLNDKQDLIRSTRIMCDYKVNTNKSIVTIDGTKMRFVTKATKKSRFFSFSVSLYDLKTEFKRKLYKNWVKFRRGNTALKIYKFIFKLSGKLPTDNKLIMFESFLGKQYSDNPRAIYEYMLKEYPEYKMYWSVNRSDSVKFEDKNIKYVRRFSISWLIKMSRAKYWVTNSRLPLWIPKPRKTIYLQTWHGTPLKRLAADMEEVHMPGTNSVRYKRNFLSEASKWDYLVSPNNYSSVIFRRAFQFDKEMIESGYPRNDYLINSNNEKTIKELKKKNNLPLDKKILLYAPTWRDNQFYTKGKYKFNLQLDLERLKLELGEEYIVILRMHYLIAEKLDLLSYEGFVFDFSTYEDIRELYLMSDILITDYSSVFFDYANLRRPMLFFVYDIDEYKDNLRGFYFDFEKEAPGPLIKTTGSLIDEINAIKENDFVTSTDLDLFYQKFCYLEKGESTKKVVDEVFKK
ncbi:CDP-glycerol glycerophosphotransferase family protein [Paraliobacillus sediminis]|uniref:CDP-glycerol glycerophosphotransferase family protein n=1 Tax=Paraliobacillus sediminis TaxID=1885916 RepID=UPI000E3EDE4E|nr:CDP-glycerol glycerophosphotransferase family protein [Paraliobacillus sediminis]